MKTMLVTGASSGIGRELALRAARAGYAVYAVGRNTAALQALATRVGDEGGTIAVAGVDIAQPGFAAPLIARAIARFERLDVLVNNAGFVSAGPIGEQSDDELQRQFGTHVIGPLALAREARAALRAAAGHIFMVGSGVARIPLGGIGAYPPAKAALRSATAILRREFDAEGIAVTYVDPGAVDTPFMTRAGMPGAPRAMLVRPETVARKILLAVATRPRELNAAGWQTTIVALAERFPAVTEALLARAPGLVGSAPPPGAPSAAAAAAAPAAPSPHAPPPDVAVGAPADEAAPLSDKASESAQTPTPDAVARALAPHERRMDKMNLRPAFVRDLLVPDAYLDAGEVALRWAGMPNKHERALTIDVLDALADAGILARDDEQRYRVVRGS